MMEPTTLACSVPSGCRSSSDVEPFWARSTSRIRWSDGITPMPGCPIRWPGLASAGRCTWLRERGESLRRRSGQSRGDGRAVVRTKVRQGSGRGARPIVGQRLGHDRFLGEFVRLRLKVMASRGSSVAWPSRLRLEVWLRRLKMAGHVPQGRSGSGPSTGSALRQLLAVPGAAQAGGRGSRSGVEVTVAAVEGVVDVPSPRVGVMVCPVRAQSVSGATSPTPMAAIKASP